jgi:TolA-binding protein
VFSGVIFVLIACGGAKDKTQLPDENSLIEQGQKAEAAGQYSLAVENYLSIVDNYPQSPYRYKAIFMAGFIQLEQLKNQAEAISLFTKLIEEYPDCDLADDAAIMKQAAISGRDLMSLIEDSLKTK